MNALNNVRGWIGLVLSLIPIINVFGSIFGIHLPVLDPSVIDAISIGSGGVGVALQATSKPITSA